MLVLYRTRNPFVFATWSARAAAASENGESESASDEGHGNNIRGQIEGAYHDEPDNVQLGNSQLEGRDNGQGNGQGPVMQPSRLHNDDNEWRET